MDELDLGSGLRDGPTAVVKCRRCGALVNRLGDLCEGCLDHYFLEEMQRHCGEALTGGFAVRLVVARDKKKVAHVVAFGPWKHDLGLCGKELAEPKRTRTTHRAGTLPEHLCEDCRALVAQGLRGELR